MKSWPGGAKGLWALRFTKLYNYQTTEASSVGTTPHLVGVGSKKINVSQGMAQIEPYFNFEKYYSSPILH